MMQKPSCIFLSLLFVLPLIINLGALKVCSLDKFSRDDFPADFVFGSGTSAYQVEGAAFEDGKTPSTWDTYSHSGHERGATADIACDGYHKYKVYSGKIFNSWRTRSWRPRLMPNGRGLVNPKGLQYYNNVIDELISRGYSSVHH